MQTILRFAGLVTMGYQIKDLLYCKCSLDVQVAPFHVLVLNRKVTQSTLHPTLIRKSELITNN